MLTCGRDRIGDGAQLKLKAWAFPEPKKIMIYFYSRDKLHSLFLSHFSLNCSLSFRLKPSSLKANSLMAEILKTRFFSLILLQFGLFIPSDNSEEAFKI